MCNSSDKYRNEICLSKTQTEYCFIISDLVIHLVSVYSINTYGLNNRYSFLIDNIVLRLIRIYYRFLTGNSYPKSNVF